MRKIRFFVLLGMTFVTQMYSLQSNAWQPIEEEILAESSLIVNSADLEDRLSAILSRAESYLLCGNKNAISDYESASFLIANLEQHSDAENFFSFRKNFGLMVAYLNENRENHAWECYHILRTTLDELPCNGQASRYDKFVHPLDNQNAPNILLVDRPIEGPDTIPLQDCLNLVNNTERFCRTLISFVKHLAAEVSLNLLIDDLADRARRCCLGGGIVESLPGTTITKMV